MKFYPNLDAFWLRLQRAGRVIETKSSKKMKRIIQKKLCIFSKLLCILLSIFSLYGLKITLNYRIFFSLFSELFGFYLFFFRNFFDLLCRRPRSCDLINSDLCAGLKDFFHIICVFPPPPKYEKFFINSKSCASTHTNTGIFFNF